MNADLEPNLITDSKLGEVWAERCRRAPIFHRPELGHHPPGFLEKMTADHFLEVDASGQRFLRTAVLEHVGERFSAPHAGVMGDDGLPLPKTGVRRPFAGLQSAPGQGPPGHQFGSARPRNGRFSTIRTIQQALRRDAADYS